MNTRTQGNTIRAPRAAQGGIVMIEVLIAVLVFSFGILGVIHLQGTAIKLNADAKLRSDASYLVGQMISQMWIDRSNLADYVHMSSGSSCTFTGSAGSSSNVTDWVGTASKPGTVLGSLPNATSQIKVETGTNLVTVTVCWRTPQETDTHNFTSTALISG
jgi:type IV pilus assembly protein PilV